MKKSVKELLKEKGQITLQLGGGEDAVKGFINVDIRDLPSVDVVHDLEVYPWPFPNECSNLLVVSHLVEHLNPHKGGFLDFMDECWRVLKPGGQIMISTPYAGSFAYYQDPTHCNPCNEATFTYFDPLHEGKLYEVYRPKPWKLIKIAWHIDENMEVLMEKRREDRSYEA